MYVGVPTARSAADRNTAQCVPHIEVSAVPTACQDGKCDAHCHEGEVKVHKRLNQYTK